MLNPRHLMLTSLCCLAALGASTVAALADDAVVATAKYACRRAKTIDATYYADRVSLVLSDGRTLTLPQAMSASGARYAAPDEAIVFWNKGRTAFITEGKPARTTYAKCVQVAGQ